MFEFFKVTLFFAALVSGMAAIVPWLVKLITLWLDYFVWVVKL